LFKVRRRATRGARMGRLFRAMSWSDVPLMTNTDELQSLVHARWQERVVDAFRERGWRPARHDASGGPVPWEEVAAAAVETIWSDVEAIVSPIVELLVRTPVVDVARERPRPARQSPSALWMSADEVAPLLRTTAHSLRRLAREGRSPIPAHRIGARWWFARAEVERFLGTGEQ
jgi:excisionase family DNA binding protein